MVWSAEMVAELKAMRGRGLSVRECAANLNVSRNSAIGKIKRLGLCKARPPRTESPTKPPRKRKYNRQADHGRVMAKEPPATPPPGAIIDISDDDIPASQRKTLQQLENHHCRWPVNEPGRDNFYFCGHPSADLVHGIPYCSCHAQRAFVPVRSRAA